MNSNTNAPSKVNTTTEVKKLIVQKYGGATLADSAKIKSVAKRISEQSKISSLIVVVSAMGKTTNELIALANEVASTPNRRELDMLLSTGERISMSLMSLALNDLGCSAVSFTGSQAGILTDESHSNAFITDIKAFRVEEALQENKVVILAGFQGVSPKTKEITTLGRGGSDTSAVAMAAAFRAERCEILKDVPGVFTADPNLVKTAKPIYELNYDQLLDMTFWGAKVLHYRSVELAKTKNVILYVGPAAEAGDENVHKPRGTTVGANEKGKNMFETCKALSVNSHETIIELSTTLSVESILPRLQKLFSDMQIAFPQLIEIKTGAKNMIYLTGPSEVLAAIQKGFATQTEFQLSAELLSSVTLTCSGATSPEIHAKVLWQLSTKKIQPKQLIVSAMSVTVLLAKSNREVAIQVLHEII